MKHFLVSLVLLTALKTSWASLGDNGDRVEDLYGNIVQRRLQDDGTVTVLYQKDKYYYLVIFANDHSVLERYYHANGTALSEKEIARFLKANAAGATWTPASDNKAKERKFERSDRRAEATYGEVNGRAALTVWERLRG